MQIVATSCYTENMRYVLAVIFGLSAPAYAETLQEWLDTLPPMTEEDRAAFDRAAAAMYSADCHCLRFLVDTGEIRRADLPLSDADRYTLIEGIRRGIYTPIQSSSDAF